MAISNTVPSVFSGLKNMTSGYKPLALGSPSPTFSGVQTPPKLSTQNQTLNGNTYNSAGDPIKGLVSPTTALKSHSVTDATGSTTTQTYHAPDPNAGLNADELLAKAKTMQTSPQNSSGSQTNATTPPVPNVPVTPTTPTTAFGTAIKGLQNIADNGSAQVNEANKALLEFKKNQGAEAQADIYGDRNYSADTATGRGAILANRYATELPAYETAVQNALTEQGQKITAEGAAANVTAPTGNFPFVFDPATGTFKTPDGGSGGGSPTLTYNPQKDASSLASLVIANKVPYQDAVAALGYAGTVGKGLLTTAIATQGGNLTNIEAQNTATQSNIQTAGTASVNANLDIYNKALDTYTQLQNSVSNVDQFGNLLTQNMGGINPSDAKYANKTIAQIRDQLSSQQQAQFDTTFAQLKARVATLLSVGGAQIPTQITADANKIIDGSAPIGTLDATLQRIQTEGNILLNNQKDIVTKSYSNVTSGGNTNTSSGNGFTEGQTAAGGALVYKNGQWVPK